MTSRRLLLLLVPGLTFGCASDANGQENLGRLLLTPEQRNALEQQRRQVPYSDAKTRGVKLTVNGEVRRNSGKSTRWINGEASHDGSGAELPVAVGDSYDANSGERESLLRDGKISIRPGKASR